MADYFDVNSKDWDKKLYRIERAGAVARAIRASVPFTGGERLLDFGCGTGLLGLNLADAVGRLYLGDTSDGMLSEVRGKITAGHLGHAAALNLDRETPPWPFDVIVSLMVLHHIDDVEAQIAELVNWTSAGGYLCLCDLDSEDGTFHRDEAVPHNGFEREFIAGCLRSCGVEVLSTRTVYVNRKTIGDREREYPVFMVTGRKGR